MIIDATSLQFGEEDLQELPPIPDEYQKLVGEWGGFYQETPNVRIVSGLDPEVRYFNGGKWWLRYASVEIEQVEYALLHRKDGSKQHIDIKDIDKYKSQGIVIPVKENITKEHPIPRYFVEIYKPPILFGSPEEWEEARNNAMMEEFEMNGKMVDIMGEYPYNGVYEPWFCIEDIEVEDGVVLGSKFREIDEEVMDFIHHQIEENKKSVTERWQKFREESLADEKLRDDKFRNQLEDALKERMLRLTGGTQFSVPDKIK